MILRKVVFRFCVIRVSNLCCGLGALICDVTALFALPGMRLGTATNLAAILIEIRPITATTF